jgi:hypothetical protein
MVDCDGKAGGRMTFFSTWVMLVLMAIVGAGRMSSSAAGVPEPAAEAVAVVTADDDIAAAVPPEPRTFESASALLEALEVADRDVRTFAAQIRYTRLFEIQGDVQTRIGNLYFRTDPPLEPSVSASGSEQQALRRRWVAVRFAELIAGGRRDVQEKLWVFDGEWLVEKDPTERQFIKRRMVRPGETYDPLRVGEGPFFVPVGQRREDMEFFFSAELRASNDGLADEYDPSRDALLKGLAKNLDGTIQLLLMPRPGLKQVEDFAMVRVWYDARTLLPRASMSVDPLGDVDVFELFGVDVNEAKAPLPQGVFDVATPGAGDGYHVEVMDEARR